TRESPAASETATAAAGEAATSERDPAAAAREEEQRKASAATAAAPSATSRQQRRQYEHVEQESERDDQLRVVVLFRLPIAFLLRRRNRFLTGADLGDDHVRGGVETFAVRVALERGRYLFARDARREGVGDAALEAIADLPPHLAIVDEHEEHETVLVLRLADGPLTSASDREVLDRAALQRGEDVDDELRAGGLLEVLELRVEETELGRAQDARAIGDPPFRRRWAVERARRG